MKTPLSGSFNEMVDAFERIVQANSALADKQGWPRNREDQENWLDEREAQRMIAHGWWNFVDIDAVPPAPVGGTRRSGGGALAAAADSAVTGLAIYRELFAGHSKPVPREEAERRAAVCVACPLNKRGSLKEWFIASVAKGITELYGIMHDLDLTTSRDKDLGTCSACLCPLRAKTFVDLATIHRHMKPDVRAKLDPACWITSNEAST